jgi:hypothetical protein
MKHVHVFLTFLLLTALLAFGQTVGNSVPGLPADTAGVFAAFAPSYDYSAFKPWHLKATYRLSDDAGNPAGEGTYEYWWASPKVYRSTWTRGSAVYTEWRTADGKAAYQGSSEALSYFEYKLQTALASPLIAVGELDPAKFRLDEHAVSAAGSIVSCFKTAPVAPGNTPVQASSFGLFPTYCFNTAKRILLGTYSFGTLVMQYINFTQFQGKPLARQFSCREGTRFFLAAEIVEIGELSPSDPAFTPPPTAKPLKLDRVQIGADIAEKLLVKKVPPVFPKDAKDAHPQGEVVLQAIIGFDGRVRDLQLVSAPKASMAFSAFRAVSQSEYKPYMQNGEPVEVETTVTVDYSPAQ